MAYTFSNELISDLHKDARGFRPSGAWLLCNWETETDAQKQATWDMLCEELEASMAAQEEAEAKALVEFRAKIRQIMDLVSCKWHDALRHLMVAEGHEVMYNTHDEDLDYFLWDQGIGYEDRIKIRNLYKEAFQKEAA